MGRRKKEESLDHELTDPEDFEDLLRPPTREEEPEEEEEEEKDLSYFLPQENEDDG